MYKISVHYETSHTAEIEVDDTFRVLEEKDIKEMWWALFDAIDEKLPLRRGSYHVTSIWNTETEQMLLE